MHLEKFRGAPVYIGAFLYFLETFDTQLAISLALGQLSRILWSGIAEFTYGFINYFEIPIGRPTPGGK